jgi:hypothetical protein
MGAQKQFSPPKNAKRTEKRPKIKRFPEKGAAQKRGWADKVNATIARVSAT